MNLPNTRIFLVTRSTWISEISDDPQFVEAEPNDLPPALRHGHCSSVSDDDTTNHGSESDNYSSEDDNDKEESDSSNESDE